jgi:hypothetical protein
VFNIQKAVSRLDFAPNLKEIRVTDIKKGIGVFTPKPGRPVSFAALKQTLKKAGYVLDAADITVKGTLRRDNQAWIITDELSGQRFLIAEPPVDLSPKSHVEVTGKWKTVGEGAAAKEVIQLGSPKQDSFGDLPRRDTKLPFVTGASFVTRKGAASDADATFILPEPAAPAAPIRVTSPGLTVYKGGAVTPRLYLIHQHLGALEVNRQFFDFSVSYTPSPRTQLELEMPVSRTSFNNGGSSGSGAGLGNITLWSKYRFFRKVKTYGDRQAAVRFGLELPTGKKDAPSQAQLNAPAFVRQQLTPINGGTSGHFDVAFSQAGGRFIFGGNAEGIVRSERAGFRLGQETRISTDTEYVLLPRKYQAPGHELFVILETTFVHRSTGRVNGLPVSGSTSTEYYLAPGIQYAAQPRFVIEGSLQFPVVRNTGPLVLRTDRNILLGVKYLF